MESRNVSESTDEQLGHQLCMWCVSDNDLRVVHDMYVLSNFTLNEKCRINKK